MLQSESSSLRSKLARLHLPLEEDEESEEHIRLVRGIDVATWKLVLSHTRVPSLRSTRDILSNQTQDVLGSGMGQMQTLELYDGVLSGEFDLPFQSFISPSSSQDSQPSDSPSSIEGSNSPTMVIWPGGPAWGRDDVEDGSGIWFEMNEAVHRQQAPNPDWAPGSCRESNVAGDIVTVFET